MRMTRIALPVAFLVALSLWLGGNAFAFGNSKFKEEVVLEASGVKLAREVLRGGYDLISTEELQKAITAGEDLLIIDTMPYEDSYVKNHIPGAKQFLFPIPDMTEWNSEETGGKSQEDFATLLGADKARKIVFYCGFVKCTRSHNGAVWARKLGYTNVLRQPGGIFAWKGAGYEVSIGK